MDKIEVTHQDGRDYLNDMIVPHNELERQISILNQNIKTKLNYDIGSLENIAKIFRNKCVDIHYMFKDITYNGDNSLKAEMINNMVLLFENGSTMLQNICPYIVDMLYSKKCSNKKVKELQDMINKYNELCILMDNYELKDNLKEILIARYNRLEPHVVMPTTFVKLYKIDLHTLTELGLFDEYKKYEEEIGNLVITRENECDDYWLKEYAKKLDQAEKTIDSYLKRIN